MTHVQSSDIVSDSEAMPAVLLCNKLPFTYMDKQSNQIRI